MIPFSKIWHVPALKNVPFSLGGIIWTPEADIMKGMKTPFWKRLVCSYKSKKKEKQMLQLQHLFITKQVLLRPLFILRILQTIKDMGYI